MRDAPYQGSKTHYASNVGKAAETEDLLLPAGLNVVQGGRWRAKWLAKWDNPSEWKIPITGCSPPMEQGTPELDDLDMMMQAL